MEIRSAREIGNGSDALDAGFFVGTVELENDQIDYGLIDQQLHAWRIEWKIADELESLAAQFNVLVVLQELAHAVQDPQFD